MAETNTGTIELLAVQVAKTLITLKENIESGNARIVFAEMGVQFPADLDSHSGFTSALQSLIATLAELPGKVKTLVEAIKSEDFGQIVTGVASVLLSIKNGIGKFSDVSSALNVYAGTKSGAEKALFQTFAVQLPEKLLAYTFITEIDEKIPVVSKMLAFFGIFELTDKNIGSVDPLNPPYTEKILHLDKIGSLITSPGNLIKNIYGWGNDTFNEALLLTNIGKALASANIPVIVDTIANPPTLDMILLEIKPEHIPGKPDGISLNLAEDFHQTINVNGNGWTLAIATSITAPTNTKLIVEPGGNLTFVPPSLTIVNGDISITWSVNSPAPDQPFILIGKANSSRWEFQKLSVSMGSKFTWDTVNNNATADFNIEGAIDKCKIVINTEGSDGFLSSVLPMNSEADFDLKLGVSTDRGFYIQGSSAFEISLPLHLELGPVEIEKLIVGLKLKDATIPVDLGADFKLMLGPLKAVVNNIGVSAIFSFPPHDGNLGPLQLDLGFKPPNGIGLSIDTGVIKGGGFLYLDFDKGEYFGALELSFQNVIDLKAVGIINTKMPDGSQGFALLILITAEFTPIQLGFGFTLNGVGGLLGLNHSTNIDALKTGVKTGAVNSILFPQDVVANITRIISDLTTVFPIVQAHFIIAPMGKLGWFTPPLITLELGIIIDIPTPSLVIIGVLRCILPSEDAPILKLQVNFAGGIDFDQGLIWFDASLFDSSLLAFTLAGDMALRIGWGSTPMFIVSVGGFHPAFHEIPSDLTNMKRLSISLLSGDNPRLTVQTYFAITSNTVQSGAKVELYAEACGFSIYGFLGYDLLVQFSPFHFIADIYAGLALRAGSSEIAGINVHCELSGPTPWNANGEASLTILFFEISIGFNVTWGDSAPPQNVEAADVLQLLKDAVNDSRNWKSEMPANTNQSVSVKKLNLPPDQIVLHPFGVLSVSQKVVPLQLTINKFGNKKPSVDTYFDITYGANPDYVSEEFAAANFLQMSDSEKLSRKSFESMKSGVKFQSTDSSSYGSKVDKDVTYELEYVNKDKQVFIKIPVFRLFASIFNVTVKGNAIFKSSYSVSKNVATNAPSKVEVAKPGYSVVNVSDMQMFGTTSVVTTEAEAYQLHDTLINQNPSLQGSIQVVSNFELN